MMTSNQKVIASLVALALIVGGVIWYQNQYGTPKNLVTYNDPKLNDEEKKQFETRIAEAEGKLEGANNEDKYRLYLQLGADYFRLGNLDKSLNAYLEASKLFPDNPVPWANAGQVAFDMNDFKAAKRYIENALKYNPTDTVAQDLMKRIEEALKK